MAFRGWKVEALEFFEGLEVDNSKSYWQAHKGVYDDVVRARWRSCSPSSNPTSARPDLPAVPRHPVQQGQVPVQDRDRRDGRGRYVQLDARPRGRERDGDGARPAERYRVAVADDRSGSKIERIAVGTSDGLDVSGHGELKTALRATEGPPADRACATRGSPPGVSGPPARGSARSARRSDRRVPRAVEAGRRMAPRARRPFDDAGARPSLICGSRS